MFFFLREEVRDTTQNFLLLRDVFLLSSVHSLSSECGENEAQRREVPAELR